MPASKPDVKLQRRVELVIRALAPALDLLLAVGDRTSRLLAREDPDYVPARMAHVGESAPRGLRSWPPDRARP